jgi:hypothetical protein
MSRAIAIRSAAGIVSTALALSAPAPAASANPIHNPSPRQATTNMCSPFTLTLQICGASPDGFRYGMPSAQSTPAARATPTRVISQGGGLEWVYGAIGAATLALTGIGVRRRRIAGALDGATTSR